MEQEALRTGGVMFATSHYEIAGAHNLLILYVMFSKGKKKNLFKILKVLPFFPLQTLKEHFDMGFQPCLSFSSNCSSLENCLIFFPASLSLMLTR